MSEDEARRQWRQPRLEASIWWCEDDECDCTQPQITRITPNFKAGYPWIHRETLWEGLFLTDTDAAEDAEREQQRAELRDACHRYGIPVPADALSPEAQ